MNDTETRRLFYRFAEEQTLRRAHEFATHYASALGERKAYALPRSDEGHAVPLVAQNDKQTSVMLVTGEHRLLFSYGILVAFNVRSSRKAYRTESKFSRTTQRHIGSWIKWLVAAGHLDGVHDVGTLPQAEIEEVLR